MKREEIKGILPEITDEQLKAILDLNGADVEKAKAKVTALETELKEKKADFDNLNAEFDKLKADGASGEEWKTKYEALQADITAKEKQAEADRILAEKTENINKRYATVYGDRQVHDAIKKSYRELFEQALENKDYEGKSDEEIFHDLIKNDPAMNSKQVQVFKLAGGNPNNVGKKYSSKEEIMKIKNDTERQQAILENGSLFGI